jgi:hypothetical protein
MIKNKIDDQLMTVASLYKHIQYKFDGLGDDFLKQVIRDWYQGNLSSSYNLTKIVKMS